MRDLPPHLIFDFPSPTLPPHPLLPLWLDFQGFRAQSEGSGESSDHSCLNMSIKAFQTPHTSLTTAPNLVGRGRPSPSPQCLPAGETGHYDRGRGRHSEVPTLENYTSRSNYGSGCSVTPPSEPVNT